MRSSTASTSRSSTDIADDILARLERMDGLNKPHLTIRDQILAQAYDISAFKIAADELLAEANVHVLLHAFATGAVMAADDRIEAVLVETKSGRFAIRGRIFVDGSGDGDLAAWAGVPYEVGDGAGNMLYPSTMFRINGVDPKRAGRAWELVPKLMEEAEQRGRIFPRKKPIVRPQRNPIEWRANLTQIKNPSGTAVSGIDARELSYGEVEGRKQCWDTFQFIKETTPGFEQAYIVEIAPQIGIRETRRVLGEYVLTEDDILGCRDFADTIGVQGWPVEAHIKGDVKFVFAPKDSRGFNEIPYRIIVPKKVDNLLVAGALRVDVARRSVVRARVGTVLHHGPGGRHGGGSRAEGGRCAARARRRGAAAPLARRRRQSGSFCSLTRRALNALGRSVERADEHQDHDVDRQRDQRGKQQQPTRA